MENLKLKSDKKLFHFYTGLDSSEKLKAIFDSFGPSVNDLVYHNARTDGANILTTDYVKRGPIRLLSPKPRAGLAEIQDQHR